MRDAQAWLTSDAAAVKRRGIWTTTFLDVSDNNGAIDWREVAADSRRTGITGTECKATEGASFVDTTFAHNRATCEHYGLRVMPYHFARPDLHPGVHGAAAEAQRFCSVVGSLHAGEWRPMLDFETPPFHADWVRAWNDEVLRRLGVAPVLYSYYSALAGMHLAKPLSAGLVLAFPNGLPRVAPCPKPWRHWTAHQYAWHGHVRGVAGAVDLNWTPHVYSLLAYPARGAALEPVYAARRRRA